MRIDENTVNPFWSNPEVFHRDSGLFDLAVVVDHSFSPDHTGER